MLQLDILKFIWFNFQTYVSELRKFSKSGILNISKYRIIGLIIHVHYTCQNTNNAYSKNFDTIYLDLIYILDNNERHGEGVIERSPLRFLMGFEWVNNDQLVIF